MARNDEEFMILKEKFTLEGKKQTSSSPPTSSSPKISKENEKHRTEVDKRVEEMDKTSEDKYEKWLESTQDKETLEIYRNKDLAVYKELLPRASISPIELIGCSSAMRGTFLSDNDDDFFKVRRSLLQTNELAQIKLKSPLMVQVDADEEFNSVEQRNKFHNLLETSGWGVAAEIKGSYGPLSASLGGDKESKTKTETERQKKATKKYFSKTMCSFVPIALWEPNIEELSFCRDVLSDLKNAEALLFENQTNVAEKSCLGIFTKYGSHFHHRDIHLGGIYKIETTYQNDTSLELEKIKRIVQSMHSVALDIHFRGEGKIKGDGDLSYHGDSSKAEVLGDLEKSERMHCRTRHSVIGGPIEVNDINAWKRGLLMFNSTWTVIDKGQKNIDDYTGIWDLIVMKRSCFKNALRLARFVHITWEKSTGRTSAAIDLAVAESLAKSSKTVS